MRETETKMGRVAQRGEGWDREIEHKRHDREAVGEVSTEQRGEGWDRETGQREGGREREIGTVKEGTERWGVEQTGYRRRETVTIT